MQQNPESAAVEARRALKRLDENKTPLKTDWYTRKRKELRRSLEQRHTTSHTHTGARSH